MTLYIRSGTLDWPSSGPGLSPQISPLEPIPDPRSNKDCDILHISLCGPWFGLDLHYMYIKKVTHKIHFSSQVHIRMTLSYFYYFPPCHKQLDAV